MGFGRPDRDHRRMDSSKLPSRDVPAMRMIRICLDRPQQPTTILGIVRRMAAEHGSTGTTGATRRAVAMPRPAGSHG
jgi:hypothetical protein